MKEEYETRKGTRLEMKVQEVKQSLETAFIDGTINSSLPKYLSNFPYFTGFSAHSLVK